jgi:hypothetical protein
MTCIFATRQVRIIRSRKRTNDSPSVIARILASWCSHLALIFRKPGISLFVA